MQHRLCPPGGRAISLIVILLTSACSRLYELPVQQMEVQSSDVTIASRVAGDLDAEHVIIAINGGPGLSSDYMISLEEMAGPQLTVVTYDQRGNGKSSAPTLEPSSFELIDYTEDLEALRQALGVERVHLLGHSFGAILAMHYASTYPGHVRSLIFIGGGPPSYTTAMASGAYMGQRIQNLQQQGVLPQSIPDGLQGILPAYFSDPNFGRWSDDPSALLKHAPQIEKLTWTAIAGYDLRQEVAELQIPVLVLWGEDDPFGLQIPEETVSSFEKADVAYVILNACGHFWQECPDLVLPRIRTFLGLNPKPTIEVVREETDRDNAQVLQRLVHQKINDPSQCPSGDQEDVRRFIAEVDRDGWSHIPAGCYQIDGTIPISAGSRIAGAGRDKTILYRQREDRLVKGEAMLSVRADGDSAFTQVTGLSLVGVRDMNDQGQDYGILLGGVPDFRIDHSYFEGFGWAGIRVDAVPQGLIDHNLFIDNFKQGVDNLGYGVAVYGNNRWVDVPSAGSDQMVFVEDNEFVGSRHAIAATAAGQYVFRHNQIRRNVIACAVDAHGMGYGQAHGTRYVEIYDNVIAEPADRWCGIGIRGGDGVIFRNHIADYHNPILLILEWGTPVAYKSSYPAKDQIRDLWIWDNKIVRGPPEPQIDETAVGFVHQGRDYHIDPKPGYTPYDYPHPLSMGGPFDSMGD